MNSKALLGKIASAMEQLAYSEDFYLETSNMLHHVEQYINDLSFRLDCDVQCSHQAIAGLLKASGLIILAHNYNVLLVDGVNANVLKEEKRITIDADLCEF